MQFIRFLGVTMLALGLAVSAANAANEIPYTQAAFTEAQKAGKPILIEIWASWCPTCKAQGPILSMIEADPANKGLVVYRVDFDSQKDVVKQFNARAQSTLIAFKGNTEAGRSVGDTNPDSIKALVATVTR